MSDRKNKTRHTVAVARTGRVGSRFHGDFDTGGLHGRARRFAAAPRGTPVSWAISRMTVPPGYIATTTRVWDRWKRWDGGDDE